MNSYDAYHHLRDLDWVDIENLRAAPPRITRDALHVAARYVAYRFAWKWRADGIGRPGSLSSESERLLADEINDMIEAAHALSDVSAEDIVKANKR